MELSPKQQINDLIKSCRTILIVSHSKLDADSLGAMLALERVLTKLEKNITIVSSEEIPTVLKFLPLSSSFRQDIVSTRDLIVRFDNDKTPIDKVSYNRDEKYLNILVTPKSGQVKPNDIEVIPGSFRYDLIFVLDTAKVTEIDPLYDKYTELFFETPIVNIDHHEGNEYFGTVNLVDTNATSTCEILVSLIESLGTNNFDREVATCLLSGIISDTDSFRNEKTTPKSLTISAQMLAAGANQPEIIKNLYHRNHQKEETKTVNEEIRVAEVAPGEAELNYQKKPAQQLSENEAIQINGSDDPISQAIHSIDKVIKESDNEPATNKPTSEQGNGKTLKPLGDILTNHQPGSSLEAGEEEAGSATENLPILDFEIDNNDQV